MSQCGDYEDIHFYVINVFYSIVIAVYFLLFKKITCMIEIDIERIIKRPAEHYGLYRQNTNAKASAFPHSGSFRNADFEFGIRLPFICVEIRSFEP